MKNILHKKKNFFFKISSRKVKSLVLGYYVCTVMLSYIPNYLIFKEHEIQVANRNTQKMKLRNAGIQVVDSYLIQLRLYRPNIRLLILAHILVLRC